MAKFRPIKKHGTGFERWKDEKTEKERRKTRLLIQRKIGKSGKTRSKKEKKRKNFGKGKIFFKRERVSFRSRSNRFRPAHISTPRYCKSQNAQKWPYLGGILSKWDDSKCVGFPTGSRSTRKLSLLDFRAF